MSAILISIIAAALAAAIFTAPEESSLPLGCRPGDIIFDEERGWFVTAVGSPWGPWETRRAAKLARVGRINEAHAADASAREAKS